MNRVTIEKTSDYLIVKIPLGAVASGKAELSSRARRIVDQAIAEGLRDIEAGRMVGPFKTVREFKSAIRRAETHNR